MNLALSSRLQQRHPVALAPRWLVAALLSFAVLLAGPAYAKKVGGVELPAELTVGDAALALNGAGLRKKLFIKLYVGSLYLPEPSSDAQAIIDADEPMSITLNILSDLLTRDKMLKALKQGFKKSTDGNTEAIQPQIDRMIELMQEKIRPGDSFQLSYEPGSGTHMSKNGDAPELIEGLDFKQALFGIWLSDKPAQASLKKAMLGGG